jgi:acyl-CoA thioester hydrolase
MTSNGPSFAHVERVRFADLDAMQHLNNVEFLRFFETARIEFLRSLTPDLDPTDRERFGFILAEARIAYRAPAFYGEDIRTEIRAAEPGRSSLRLDFEMRVPDDGGRLVAEGHGVLVGYSYAEGSSRPLPDALRERLAHLPAAGEAAP